MNPTDTSDFKNLVDLLAVYSDATARMDAMQAEINQEYFDLVDARRKEYTELQATVTKAESAIEALATAHPEWFVKRKTVSTAYGSVSSRSTPKLDIPNEEASILLIEREYAGDEEKLGQYLRTAKALNIEALENLDDRDLKALRIHRIREEKVTVKAKKLDLGKAVATEQSEAA